MKHTIQIVVKMVFVILDILISAFYGLIYHDSLRRMTKHLCHIQVKRLHTISLLETEMSITCRLTDHIHRRTFTLGNLLNMV